MRFFLLLFLFLFLFTSTILAAEEQTNVAQEEDGAQFNERILEDPKFKEHVTICEKKAEANNPVISLEDCINTAFSDLDTPIQEELLKKYVENKEDPSSAPDKKLTNYQQIRPQKFSKETLNSPQFKALRAYLGTRLEEAMYGKDPKSKKMADHGTYYELYTNQVSKNIILNLSSFCLDARHTVATIKNPTNNSVLAKKTYFYLSKSDQTNPATRNLNLAKLGTFSTVNGNQKNNAQLEWDQCIAQIADLCTNGAKISEADIRSNLSVTTGDFSQVDYPTPTSLLIPPDLNVTEDTAYTQDRACMVTHVLKEQKLVLSATENIKEDLKKQLEISNIAAGGVKYDELTTVTSGEMKDNYSDKTTKLIEELKECEANPDTTKCKKLITQFAGEKESLQKSKIEFGFLSESRNNKLKDDLDNDQTVKGVILTENNLKESDMQQIEDLEDQEILAIKAQINKSYANEAAAIKSKIQEKITAANNNTAAQQLRAIRENIERSAESKTALTHYNNIISGYLTASGQNTSGTSPRPESNNLKMIKRELDDSAYKADRSIATSGTNSVDQDRLNNIEAGTDLTKIKEGQEASGTFLGVDTINKKLLKFNKEQQRPNN